MSNLLALTRTTQLGATAHCWVTALHPQPAHDAEAVASDAVALLAAGHQVTHIIQPGMLLYARRASSAIWCVVLHTHQGRTQAMMPWFQATKQAMPSQGSLWVLVQQGNYSGHARGRALGSWCVHPPTLRAAQWLPACPGTYRWSMLRGRPPGVRGQPSLV